MKRLLVLVLFAICFTSCNALAYDKSFIDKFIHEYVTSCHDSGYRVDIELFSKYFPKFKDYEYTISKEVSSTDSNDDKNPFSITTKVTVCKYIDYGKKTDIIKFVDDGPALSGEGDSLKIYDLSLLGLPKKVKRNSKQIESFIDTFAKFHNLKVARGEDWDDNDDKKLKVYTIMLGVGPNSMLIHYYKSNGIVKYIEFSRYS